MATQIPKGYYPCETAEWSPFPRVATGLGFWIRWNCKEDARVLKDVIVGERCVCIERHQALCHLVTTW